MIITLKGLGEFDLRDHPELIPVIKKHQNKAWTKKTLSGRWYASEVHNSGRSTITDNRAIARGHAAFIDELRSVLK